MEGLNNSPQTSSISTPEKNAYINEKVKSSNKTNRLITDGLDKTPLPLKTDEFDNVGEDINHEYHQHDPDDYSPSSNEIIINRSSIELDEIKIKTSSVDIISDAVQDINIFNDRKMTDELVVLLTETDTEFLFEIPSISEEKHTDLGKDVELDNANYDYMTIGKGKNRKKVTSETQTEECIRKTRFTITSKIDMKDDYAFASTWDMYDSFADTKTIEIDSKRNSKFNIELDIDPKSKDTKIQDVLLKNIVNNPRFIDSVIIMERVLANNVFKSQLQYFKGLDKLEDTPELFYLWSFDSKATSGRPVSSISWNKQNQDILGVGYGKYHYTDNTRGVVAIWSIKNPIQPERLYEFSTPVTSVSFSGLNPNLLSVGFYNGDVIIIDITAYKKKIIAQCDTDCPSYKPIWQVNWYSEDNALIENVITINQNGRINKYTLTKTQDFICTQMMIINRVEGSIKDGLKFPKYHYFDIPIAQNPPCLVLCFHPKLKDVYYVGTIDGCIYKCTMNYSYKHLDIFIAHDGPVFGMQYSSFCDKIFLTCGADSTVKIWIEGVADPLIILKAMDPIESAAFHPTHSTIIAAISNTKIHLWDLKHTHSMLLTDVEIPSDPMKFTTLKFTKDGRNLIVGDVKGRVHVYNMSGIRNVVNDERDLLHGSIQKALTIKSELLKRFNKALKFEQTHFG